MGDYVRFRSLHFKSRASANFATRAVAIRQRNFIAAAQFAENWMDELPA